MSKAKFFLKLILPPVLFLVLRWVLNARKNWSRRGLKDLHLYKPKFSPWLELADHTDVCSQIKKKTLVSDDRLWVLLWGLRQALSLCFHLKTGSFCEFGVYKGGTAKLIFSEIENFRNRNGQNDTDLHLFDSFEGMPETNPTKDFHRAGDFNDTTLDAVQAFLGPDKSIKYHKGMIPNTFAATGIETIAFAHIDLDIYQSVKDACLFVYEKAASGAIIIFDDYGFPSCPGAREAVDEFFSKLPEQVLVLKTGQALVVKL